VRKIVETLSAWQQSDIDVELLLETLTKLDSKEQEPLLRFYTGGEFILGGYPEKRPLIEYLKDFIKRKAIIEDQEKIRYLEPLLGFVEEHKPLRVFSVNYDTCIEQFCNVYRLNCQDGFDINWNPQVFERDNVDIMLHKLHGSIIWYRSDRGGYIKLPIMTEAARVKLFTGEKAESLMLYPMQKFDYPEPLLELLMRFRNALQTCKVLIVVGYSFRDAHLRGILLDAARNNSGLTLMLVDPKAWQIYHEKLKYFDSDSQIPSSLDGKVVCLPYRFEDVLPLLKYPYVSNLKLGLTFSSTFTSNERLGNKANWIDCLKPLINAEHIEKVQSLLDEGKVRRSDLSAQWELDIELSLKTAFNLAANSRMADARTYISDLKQILREILHNRLGVEVVQMAEAAGIAFMFNMRDHSASGYITDSLKLKSFMQTQYEYLISRSKMTINDAFMAEFGFIKAIVEYLQSFSSSRITFDEYVSMRGSFVKDPNSLRASMLAWVKGNDPRVLEEFPAQLLAIERQVTGGLLS
jgi:hypothetical protein